MARLQLMRLGIATVYRNLANLVERSDVVAAHLLNDTVRYEPSGRGHHHHFYCTSCEHVFELDAQCPVASLEELTLAGGFRVEDHALTFYGSCPNCQT